MLEPLFVKAEKQEVISTDVCRKIEKATEYQKELRVFFIDYIKAFDYIIHVKLWKS